jgi:hypothetical protein
MNENRKTSLETNPPPPNIIKELISAPGKRMSIFRKMVAGVSVFMILLYKVKVGLWEIKPTAENLSDKKSNQFS